MFLDELGELSGSAQAALLRVLETKKISRLGSPREIEVDVRIIAATHCNLTQMVEEGTFRRDLLYRLNTVTVDVPPLRDRADEIEALSTLFLRDACENWKLGARSIAPEATAALQRYSWPGNIRQLRNVIERAALVTPDSAIRVRDLPRQLFENEAPDALVDRGQGTIIPSGVPTDSDLKTSMKQVEAALIRDALRRTAGNRASAAKLLRIPLRTLFRRMKLLGVEGETD